MRARSRARRYHLSPEEDVTFEREFLEPEQRFVRRGAMDPTKTTVERGPATDGEAEGSSDRHPVVSAKTGTGSE